MKTSKIRKPEAVLFDLDGTLLDTAPDFHWVINQLLTKNNLPAQPYVELRKHVSNGANAMLKAAFKLSDGDSKLPSLNQQMLSLYDQHLANDSKLFPGIKSLLATLEEQQIPWGIVTNKPKRFTAPILSALKLSTRSASTICPDHVNKTKPDPEPLLLACQQIQVTPQNCIYIGDHIRDIDAGNRADMFTIGALYGYINESENADNWNANAYVQHADQILSVIDAHF
ncbi:HAD family hydrolase [Neptunomonas japonica]|uniref:Phosphoglycolate phosphatase n=1 Tax=Neptunomonas japonica JAMM 1380 TaxID=1441457 RepID=A0A7R6PFU8_9GAMM|nr:HAD-IA family hydrolase [Neptunomonas japonica]BBB28838.1 phosphoglycolate phosphatase [Neptunomonas japonica JAMM 1380]